MKRKASSHYDASAAEPRSPDTFLDANANQLSEEVVFSAAVK